MNHDTAQMAGSRKDTLERDFLDAWSVQQGSVLLSYEMDLGLGPQVSIQGLVLSLIFWGRSHPSHH